MVRFTLKPGDSILRGLVIGKDGRLHFAQLDLDYHYENDDGKFKPKKDGYFSATCEGTYLWPEFIFVTFLKSWSHDGEYLKNVYELYKDIQVRDDGSIWIQDPYVPVQLPLSV
jgi:hypothetical protein